MNAAILVIGDEILIGQVQDTNSGYLARQLHQLGIKTDTIITVHDDAEAIISKVDELLDKHILVFTTGGLGPTSDDKTKQVLADYFSCGMSISNEVLEHIKTFFTARNLPMIGSNIRQAEVPDKAEILFNELGTAPGLHFRKNGHHLFVMPGVPYEMKSIFENHIIGRLQALPGYQKQVSKTIIVANIGESFLAEMIAPWENALPEGLSLAYLPSPGLIRLRLTGSGTGESLINDAFAGLMPLIGSYFVSDQDLSLPEILGQCLLGKNLSIATAESCTGGYIAHLLTSIAGSSAYFKGSVVAYDNSIKENILSVPRIILENDGAVSHACVRAMAENICKLYKTDVGIAVSGIAGPAGGTSSKPVGTVFIAIAIREQVETFGFHFGSNRAVNITRSANAAIVQCIHSIRKIHQ